MGNRMVCKKCGKEMKAGAKFCDKCGAPIQQKEKKTLPKIDKRILYIMVSVLGICAAVIVLFGISCVWKYMFPSADMRLVKEEVYIGGNSPSFYTEYSYDEVGNLVKIISYDKDGNVCGSSYAHGPEDYFYSAWKEFSYDEAGNLVKDIDYDETGTVVGREEYSYNEVGTLVAEYGDYDYSITKLERRIEYSYDETGNLVRKIYDVYNKESGISSTYEIIYVYDSAGNLLRKENMNEGSEWEGEYDSSGNLVKETKLYYDGGGHEITYSYDNSGNLVKETKLNKYKDGSEVVSETIYSYDNSDNLVKTANSRGMWTTYSYDKDGNLVTEQDYYSDGTCRGYIYYSYDKAGNLIKEEGDYYGDKFKPEWWKIYTYK